MATRKLARAEPPRTTLHFAHLWSKSELGIAVWRGRLLGQAEAVHQQIPAAGVRCRTPMPFSVTYATSVVQKPLFLSTADSSGLTL
jgi:hypothetical protein